MNGKRSFVIMLVTASLIACAGVQAGIALQEIQRFITNYPNPFDSRSEGTTIVYSLAVDASVRIRIYDLLGNPVRQFPSAFETAGLKHLVWDGTDDEHRKVAKGGYICVVEIANAELQYMTSRKIGVIH